MIKLNMPVIVEGKYDKITLENIVDALIIKTDGFGIFKDKEKIEMIRALEKKCGGIIVMTDSDSAGNMLRSYIKKIVGENGNIINVYVPCIKGKEKRKTSYSKEGILGVEGMDENTLTEALKKSGIDGQRVMHRERSISKADLFSLGLSGSENSSKKRKELLEYLKLPANLSPNAMLDILNTYFDKKELLKAVSEWQNSQTKS